VPLNLRATPQGTAWQLAPYCLGPPRTRAAALAISLWLVHTTYRKHHVRRLCLQPRTVRWMKMSRLQQLHCYCTMMASSPLLLRTGR